MGFAKEYLRICTECDGELKQFYDDYSVIIYNKRYTLSNYKTVLSKFIIDSTDGWGSYDRFSYTNEINNKTIDFDFSDIEMYFFRDDKLNQNNEFIPFIISLVSELEIYKDDPVGLKLILQQAEEQNKIYLFLLVYVSALYAKIINNYNNQYEKLKNQYTNLTYYPVFEFISNIDLDSYYESSRCY